MSSSGERLVELGLLEMDLKDYLAGGIVLFNLSSGEMYKEVILEMSKVRTEYQMSHLT